MYIIVVGSSFGTVPGVHVRPNPLDALDGDVMWQKAVELIGQLLAVEFLGIEMSHHVPGMYARVGASRAGDVDRVSQDGGQGVLDDTLHGDALGLYLPAMISRSVETQVYEITMLHKNDVVIVSGCAWD